MIRPHAPFAARYVDYGKVFTPNGALDFSTLAYSDGEVARYGPQLFNRGLLFPESSPFASQIGAVSAALLMFEGGFLFTLVQRRREGELSAHGNARTDRPFNQVRFVILTREMIEQAFAARTGLYTSLALAARDPAARVWLKDYTASGEEQAWSPPLKRVDPSAPDPEAVRFVANALVAAAVRSATEPSARGNTGTNATGPQPISVPLPRGDLLENLQLVEAVQYWVLPRLGVISFALDYVSIQNVHLRLFHLPTDAPAPLPPDRVFALRAGPGGARFADDYYTSVSGLAHEALYDAALPGLLALRVTTAEAVNMFKIEKYGQPFPGTEALRLYPEPAQLGERRFNFLRRVPRDDLFELLRRAELPAELRLDLLQVAFEAAHGLLVLYAPVHLAVPRPARDDERIRALLRASLGKSPEVSLDVWAPGEQAELFRDLLLARRAPPPAGRALTLATGQPLLEALLLWHRTPALAAALQEVVAHDPALFGEALAVLDQATDLKGLLWLWQNAGQRELKNYCALLERAVQPAWYAKLARDAETWRELLAEGRALALNAPAGGQTGTAEVGSLLRVLPRALVPFVWQASLATAEHDAAFAEWWLFNEALALPEQLPALWEALQRLPAEALRAAGPELNYLLGRVTGLSLLQACTPPGYSEASEALYATVLRAWLASGFRSPVGDLALANEDIRFLIAHLPESNDILAAIAASSAQAPAVHGLPPDQALHWAQAASGERRKPYRPAGHDCLFQRLIELPAPNEPLLWHLLVEDEGTAGGAMPWANYAALVTRSRAQVDALQFPPQSRLRAYLEVANGLQNRDMAETFYQNHIDIRRVFVLLAAHPVRAARPGPSGRDGQADPASAADLMDSLLPLTAFHLQETNPDLKKRAADLLRAGLQRPDVTTHLQGLPDNVLAYLRQHFCEGHPALAAAGHWIEAELSRRNNAYHLKAPAKAAAHRPGRARPASEPAASAPSRPPTAEPAATERPSAAVAGAATPPPAAQAAPLLGEVALPGAGPKTRDTAVLLWIAIVVILLLTCAVLVGAIVWIQSLPSAKSFLDFLYSMGSFGTLGLMA